MIFYYCIKRVHLLQRSLKIRVLVLMSFVLFKKVTEECSNCKIKIETQDKNCKSSTRNELGSVVSNRDMCLNIQHYIDNW